MKSRIIGLLAAFTLVITASADVLLWQVPETSITGATDIYGGSQSIDQSSGDYAWSYAMLQYTTGDSGNRPTIEAASQNSTSLATYWRGNSLEGNGNHANASMSGRTLSSNLATESDANYYIALYNSQNQLMGYSSYLENISDFTAASHNIADWSGVNTGASGSGWTAAPEPTSGVLLLLGAAVLGLRRRKVA